MLELGMPEIPAFTKKVPFADTDMAGIVHFSRILGYVEEAEHAAMSRLGAPVIDSDGGFPKVHVDCDYKRPLKFNDSVSIELGLIRVGSSSLTWKFSIKVGNRLAAEGSMVTVYVSSDGTPCKIPDAIRVLLS